jgi:3-methyladenine DNA glycosylase/8-oxoguanine DNA glycosylase
MLPTPHQPDSQPYHWDLLVAVLSRFAAQPLFCLHSGAYWRIFRADTSSGNLALMRIRPGSDGNLTLTPIAVSGAVDALPPAQRCLRVVGFTAEALARAASFCQFARGRPELWAWVQPLEGIPMLLSEDLYEALVFTVIEQHISWVSALKVQERFVRLFGATMLHEGSRYGTLPTPAQLASLREADLAPLRLTRARLNLLLHIGRLFAEGAFDDWEVKAPRDMYAGLLQIRGVGHWTASVAVARAYGHSPYIHDNDVALQAAVGQYLLGGGGRATRAQTLAAFSPYGEWAGDAAHYLMMRWILDKYKPAINPA